MATTKTTLAKANGFVSLGTVPCTLQCLDGDILFVIASSVPSTGADAHVFGGDKDKFLDIGLSGQNLYAMPNTRASANVVVSR